MYVRRTGDDAETAALEKLAAIRAEAARRAGWEPWMTGQAGYAAVDRWFCYQHFRWEIRESKCRTS